MNKKSISRIATSALVVYLVGENINGNPMEYQEEVRKTVEKNMKMSISPSEINWNTVVPNTLMLISKTQSHVNMPLFMTFCKENPEVTKWLFNASEESKSEIGYNMLTHMVNINTIKKSIFTGKMLDFSKEQTINSLETEAKKAYGTIQIGGTNDTGLVTSVFTAISDIKKMSHSEFISTYKHHNQMNDVVEWDAVNDINSKMQLLTTTCLTGWTINTDKQIQTLEEVCNLEYAE